MVNLLNMVMRSAVREVPCYFTKSAIPNPFRFLFKAKKPVMRSAVPAHFPIAESFVPTKTITPKAFKLPPRALDDYSRSAGINRDIKLDRPITENIGKAPIGNRVSSPIRRIDKSIYDARPLSAQNSLLRGRDAINATSQPLNPFTGSIPPALTDSNAPLARLFATQTAKRLSNVTSNAFRPVTRSNILSERFYNAPPASVAAQTAKAVVPPIKTTAQAAKVMPTARRSAKIDLSTPPITTAAQTAKATTPPVTSVAAQTAKATVNPKLTLNSAQPIPNDPKRTLRDVVLTPQFFKSILGK